MELLTLESSSLFGPARCERDHANLLKPRLLYLQLALLSVLYVLFAPIAPAQVAFILPDARIGFPYSVPIVDETNSIELSWQILHGGLPPGLRIANGAIQGTPLPTEVLAYSFELRGLDQQRKNVIIRSFSISIQTPRASAVDSPPISPEPGRAAPSTLMAGPPEWHFPRTSSSAALDPPKGPAGAASTGVAGGPLLRTIVGFEQAGVSAAQSTQDFFFDLMYDRPLGFKIDDDLGPALRSWGNLRISSVPQQISTDVATFAADFAQQVGQVKVNQVAQAFEFLGGIEYRLWASPHSQPYNSTDPVHDPQIQTRISLNLLFGGGVITPLSPQDSVKIFDVPANQPLFLTEFPEAAGKQFVAFTLPDRNRFFPQAYGGFRLFTHFLGDTSHFRFPETFDLTYGFNEAITGGRIRGGVMRLEGFVPIPYSAASWIYFFGTGTFKPGAHATVMTPFLLNAAPAGTLPTDPNAVVIVTPQADRDYYRVGIGIDLIALIAQWRK